MTAQENPNVTTQLRSFEQVLKELNQQLPERHLEEPHHMEEIQDVIQEASLRCKNIDEQKLLTQHLDEERFFSDSSNVEIYQHFRYLPPYWHTHTFIEIACLVRGSCFNYIGNQKVLMQPGDICIIAPDTQHAISAFSDDCLLYNFIIRTSTFETAFFGVLSDNDVLSDFFMRSLYRQNSDSFLLFRTGDDPELLECSKSLLRESVRNRQYRGRMMNAYLSMFFIILLRNHSADIILSNSDSRRHDNNTVPILKYMEENCSTVTVAELASFFSYSERQIQRIIKNSTGMSFSQNIQKIKLSQAVQLLKSPGLSVADISKRLGYSAPENFRQAFKKHYGMTPTEYRAAHAEEE